MEKEEGVEELMESIKDGWQTGDLEMIFFTAGEYHRNISDQLRQVGERKGGRGSNSGKINFFDLHGWLLIFCPFQREIKGEETIKVPLDAREGSFISRKSQPAYYINS